MRRVKQGYKGVFDFIWSGQELLLRGVMHELNFENWEIKKGSRVAKYQR